MRGTYPFWVEGLGGLRGPVSIPPAVIHGRTVQGIAFQKDQKGAGAAAIVQLKVSVGRTGKVDRGFVCRSGFLSRMPRITCQLLILADARCPQPAGAKREWEFEVAFFTPKN